MMEKVALIDGDIIPYEYGSCKDLDGNPLKWQYVQSRVQSRLDGIMAATKADRYRIWLSDPVNNFRKEIATILPYKGNRPSEKPFYWQKIRDFLVNYRKAQVTEWIEADDQLSIDQCEADGYDTVICSIDKDLDMVPGDHYNWRRDEYYTVSDVESMQNFFKQMLTGDSVDNILGLYGVGPKSVHVTKINKMTSTKDMFDHVLDRYRDRFGAYAYTFYDENETLLWMLRTTKEKEYWIKRMRDAS